MNNTLKDKTVLILGLGLHGGGKSAILYSHAQKAKQILVSELAPKEKFSSLLPELDTYPIQYEFATHSRQYIDQAEYIIKNPAIPPNSSILHYAIVCKKNIVTDISLFLQHQAIHHTNVGISMVTGTKGKSSISTAIFRLHQEHFAQDKQKINNGTTIELVGNIRNSTLSFLMEQKASKHIVCELSAQQSGDLQYVSQLYLDNLRCLVFTNFMRDHLNYYKNMEDYFNHKIYIFKKFAQHIQQQTKQHIHISEKQTKNSVVLPNDIWGRRVAELYAPEQCIWHSSNAVLETDKCGAWVEQQLDTQICYYRTQKNTPAKICCAIKNNSIGINNTTQHSIQPYTHETLDTHYLIQNILIIIAYCITNNLPIPNNIDSFRKLLTLEHRKESLGTIHNIHFINDSAATIPHAMQIKSFSTQAVFLICGGTDKNLIAQDIIPECKAASHCYLLAGNFTDAMLPFLTSESIHYSGPFISLEEATYNAILDTKKMNNDKKTEPIIILSPGCASFGMFKHEFDRGDTFKRIVQKYRDGNLI